MKKLIALLLSLLTVASLALPCLAAEDGGTVLYHEEIDLGDDVTAIEELVEYRFARSSEKTSNFSRTYYKNGVKVADITLYGRFSYTGTSSKAENGAVSKTTYNGWSYSQNSLSYSGNTVSLSATLSKSGSGSIAVSMSLSCDSNGTISKG